jgi:uncharacterized membrane protein
MRVSRPAPASSPQLPPSPAASPRVPSARSSRRAIGVDVARAVALIGMIAVHVFPESNDNDEMTWIFGTFGGRAAALFALLAGVSLAFVEKRSRGQLHGRTLVADRAALVVRGLLILLAGLLLGHLEVPIQTIIPYFGVLFLLAVPLYGRSSRLLLLLAPFFALLGPVLLHLYGADIPEQADPEADYTVRTALAEPVPFVADMLLTGFYPVILWMVYVCVGMVIGRQTLTSSRVALRLVVWGGALAAATWALSKILLGPAGGLERLVAATPEYSREEIVDQLAYGPELTLLPDTTWWWLAAISPYSNTPLNVLHNLGSVVAALGIVLLLCRRDGRILSPFTAIGAMTLTLYSAHCVVLYLEVLDEERPVVSLWIQVISFMLFALVWRSSMGRGPLETIVSDASDWVRTRIRTPRERPPRAAPSAMRGPGRRRRAGSGSAASAASGTAGSPSADTGASGLTPVGHGPGPAGPAPADSRPPRFGPTRPGAAESGSPELSPAGSGPAGSASPVSRFATPTPHPEEKRP